jgi:dTDP-4-dehydrorhamnose reductase
MYVWVIGSRGFLGRTLLSTLTKHAIPYCGSTHAEADITQLDSMRAYARLYPSITHIVNCAALAHVDLSEENPQLSYALNALGAAHVGQIAKELNVHLLHISTDYVFGGDWSRRNPYREEDLTAPVNIYGTHKLEGEERLLELQCNLCIVRTAWLFGPGKNHFAQRVLDNLNTGKPIQAVQDQTGSPTYTPDLCKALIKLLPRSGIFHITNSGGASRYEFACAVQKLSQIPGRVEPVSAVHFHTPAKRPAYSVLESYHFPKLRPWRDALQEYLHAPL